MSAEWDELASYIPINAFRYRDEFPAGKVPPGNHNGASSPFAWTYPFWMTDQQLLIVRENSRRHDWQYLFGHLPGSPTENVSRKDSDKMYREHYEEHRSKKDRYLWRTIGNRHYRFLRPSWAGGHAWRRNTRDMNSWGYYTFAHYINRKDQELGGLIYAT